MNLSYDCARETEARYILGNGGWKTGDLSFYKVKSAKIMLPENLQ